MAALNYKVERNNVHTHNTASSSTHLYWNFGVQSGLTVSVRGSELLAQTIYVAIECKRTWGTVARRGPMFSVVTDIARLVADVTEPTVNVGETRFNDDIVTCTPLHSEHAL